MTAELTITMHAVGDEVGDVMRVRKLYFGEVDVVLQVMFGV